MLNRAGRHEIAILQSTRLSTQHEVRGHSEPPDVRQAMHRVLSQLPGLRVKIDQDEGAPPSQPAPRGFSSFSSLLSSDPDLQVYRRFDRLAARNLAYLQSEIAHIEAEIASLDAADQKEGEAQGEDWLEVQRSARCWEVLARKAKDGCEREVALMQLIRQLRLLMAEYQDALLRQSRVLNLDEPNSRVKEALTVWYANNRPLIGHSYDLFSNERDLVALRTPPDQDRLSSFLQDQLGPILHKESVGQPAECADMRYFPERTITHLVAVVSVLLSAVLLMGAIVALYFIQHGGVKLGVIAIFTTLFAGSVGLLTNARKAEVYAATAAYAAVLVVFVSGNLVVS